MNIHMQRSFIRTIILIGWRLRFTSVVVVKDKVKPSFTTRTTSNNTSLQQCYTTLYNVLRLRLRNCRTGFNHFLKPCVHDVRNRFKILIQVFEQK